MKTLRIIIAFGILLSSIFLIDALLPKIHKTTTVSKIDVGLESSGGSHSRAKQLTHFIVLLDDGPVFRLSKSKQDLFADGNSVEFSTSQIFKRPTYLQNTVTGKGSIPVKGLYSYFFILPIILFMCSMLGVKYRYQYTPLTNCAVGVMFSGFATLVIAFLF